MVCTINSAGQARTRHDTSLGYLHLLAKEVDTNKHRDKKKRKRKKTEKKKKMDTSLHRQKHVARA